MDLLNFLDVHIETIFFGFFNAQLNATASLGSQSVGVAACDVEAITNNKETNINFLFFMAM